LAALRSAQRRAERADRSAGQRGVAPPTTACDNVVPTARHTPVPQVSQPAAKEFIRVDPERLDRLINVIGEMVISASQVQQELTQVFEQGGRGTHQDSHLSVQLNKLVRDLQELGLSLRMVPVDSVFQKMARIVRDLSRKLDKRIELETEGGDLELDKQLVDQLADPLMHMIRNAADHGIESPAERLAVGKPPGGTITLRAYRRAGSCYVDISDDGRGLNRAQLLAKARQRGIIAEQATLSDREICELIFAPGLSTAQEVTDVSGRGVGMDVVRRNIEALRGSITIDSEEGTGATVTLRLPMTSAVVDGLWIRGGDETYIVPRGAVVDSFRPVATAVLVQGDGQELVEFGSEVVPLLRLQAVLGREPCAGNLPHDGLVVIVEEAGRKFGLLADQLLGQSQVVVKRLEAQFDSLEGVAGATILGNGRVALILDVPGLLNAAARRGGG
jgi:two-component system, chemotaxis family, sensor kinase CheA